MVSDDIKFLVSRRFPESAAPPPPGSGQKAQTSWQGRQLQRKAYWEELAKLTPTEIRTLVDAEFERMRQADSARRALVSPAPLPIDAAYWKRQEVWFIQLASVLVCGIDPRRGLGYNVSIALPGGASALRELGHVADLPAGDFMDKLSDQGRELLELANEIQRNARVATDRTLRIEHGCVVPKRFLVWARERGYQVPSEFASLLDEEPTIAELQERIRTLEQELEFSVDQFDPDDKQYPPELDVALQAWTAVRKAPAEAGTSPKNRLRAWISEHHTDLTNEAIERLAIVANWEKQAGRKAKSRK